MKWIPLLLLFAAFTSASLLFAQGNNNTKYYSPSQPVNASDFVLNQADEVIAIGGSPWDNNAWFLHLDSAGSIVSSRYYGTGSLKKLLRATDTSFVAVGYSYAGPATLGNHAIVVGLDASGDTLWTRELYSSSANSSMAWDVQLTIDSNILVAGECNNGLNAFVVKLNPSGNVIWSRVFASQEPLTTSFKFFALQVDSAGSIALAGQRVSDIQVYGVLMKLLDDGTVVWSKSGGVGTSFQALLTMDSEHYVVNAYSSTLFKTDSLGTVQWAELTVPAYNEFEGVEFSLVKETDTSLLFTGHNMWSGGVVRVNPAGEIMESGNQFGKAFKTRKRADGKYSMMLNGPIYGIKSALVLTPHTGICVMDSLSQSLFCSENQAITPMNMPMNLINSNVLQTGQMTVSHPNIQVTVFDMLSEDGCIDFLAAVDELGQNIVQLFPNPSVSTMHVSIKGDGPVVYHVFNSLGKTMCSGSSVAREFDLDVQSFDGGTYFFQTGNTIRMFTVVR
jgi:hypothetical protein